VASPQPLVLAIDQGTSHTKAVAVDIGGRIVHQAQAPLAQQHPRAGWVEHRAKDALDGVMAVISDIQRQYTGEIAAVGLSNQRESALAWSSATGEPLSPLISWQDRRCSARARELRESGHLDTVRRISGLPIDPMFSALKFGWILDSIEDGRGLAERGGITLGTVDSWLMMQLTGQATIEMGNASRTQLLSVETGDWDDDLLAIFGIPRAALPTVVSSDWVSEPVSVPHQHSPQQRIHAVLGDSHAALFGHGIRQPGQVKATYGTGSSVMGLGSVPHGDASGVVRTIAWARAGEIAHAVEGNILSTGSTLVWLATLLNQSVDELALLAASPEAAGNEVFVPAFAGLGAPWWDESAVALVSNLHLGTGRAALARAAFESVVLQVDDVVAAVEEATGKEVATLLVDGGPTSNDWLMQLQANVSQKDVKRSENPLLSALGVAHLAGISAGVWSEDDVAALHRDGRVFRADGAYPREELQGNWRAARGRSRMTFGAE